MDPISLSIALIALVGSLITGIIMLFKNINCADAELKSSCCSDTNDIHENKTVNVGK